MIGLLVALLVILPGIYILYGRYQKYIRDHELSEGEMLKLALGLILVLGGGMLAFLNFINIDTGHAVIWINPITHTVTGPSTGPAWTFKLPWVRAIDIYYATTSTEMWTDNDLPIDHPKRTGEYPAIHVLSQDGLDIEVDILIRYQLDPNSLVDLYRSFPNRDWEDRVISSVVREDVRDVIGQFTAIEVIERREALSTIMTNTIFNSLIEEPTLNKALLESTIQIDLRDIDPTSKFKEAVEAKLTAEQQKIQAEFERERRIVQANATAIAALIEAQGQANAIEKIKIQAGDYWLEYYRIQKLSEMAMQISTFIYGGNDFDLILPTK